MCLLTLMMDFTNEIFDVEQFDRQRQQYEAEAEGRIRVEDHLNLQRTCKDLDSKIIFFNKHLESTKENLESVMKKNYNLSEEKVIICFKFLLIKL